MAMSSAEILGARLLGEIKAEEGTLEDLLSSLRTTLLPPPSITGLPRLDGLIERHNSNATAKPKLSITGRGLPLLYHIISTLVTSRNGTVTVIDLDGRFSPSHLRCDLDHVYIFRPEISADIAGDGEIGAASAAQDLKKILESVEKFMLYGKHGSYDREWVGTMVNGGLGGDICVAWNGWLNVDREEVVRFPAGISVEEAIGEKEKRQEVVDGCGWRGRSRVGWYGWKEE
ncbi:hypothetical protein B7463_g4485, partial [Scytalidium lignicola]